MTEANPILLGSFRAQTAAGSEANGLVGKGQNPGLSPSQEEIEKKLDGPISVLLQGGTSEKRAKQIAAFVEARDKVVNESPDLALKPALQGRGLPPATPYMEEPWHQQAAALIAVGYPAKEVARLHGKCTDTVRKLLRRPEFQAMVLAVQDSNGLGKDLSTQFRAEVAASLHTLVELRDSEKTSASVKTNICFGLIERVLGKAKQELEVTHSQGGDPVEEFKRLENANKQLKEGLN